MKENQLTRRAFLATAGATLGAMRVARTDYPKELGAPPRAYGERSPFEQSVVRFLPKSSTPASSYSRTPLQDLFGIITPSALHYEVHHSGVPEIDPRRHEVMIHGLVERPLIFTMDDLHRLPSISRIHFLECAGNSGGEQIGRPAMNPQRSHGLLSCSEWTGVPLRTLLEQVGVKSSATWIVAEGADAGRMARSIPLEKALDDVLVAYGQNGEALRPEQGYPVRLIVPGWEGNTNIKWLRRVQVVDQPYMTAYETGHYTDLMPDGTARQFTFVMEAKSVITRPAGGQQLSGPGFLRDYRAGMVWAEDGSQKPRCPQTAAKAGKRRNSMSRFTRRRSLAFVSVVVGRKRDFTPIAMHGRDRLSAADARGTCRGSRTQCNRPLQRNQNLVRPRGREGQP